MTRAGRPQAMLGDSERSGPVATHLVAWLLLEREDGQILLARRSGVRYGDGLWGPPGGHADRREPWAAAAAREAREEVGVEVAAADLVPVGVQRYVDGEVHGVDVFFRARSWRGEARPVSECSEVGWFDPARLPDDSLEWLPAALDLHLVRGVWLAEVGLDA